MPESDAGHLDFQNYSRLLGTHSKSEETQPLLASATSQHRAGRQGYFLISSTQSLEQIHNGSFSSFLPPPNVPLMESSPGPAPILQFSEEMLLSLISLWEARDGTEARERTSSLGV